MKSSLEIAQEAELVPIEMIAESCGLQPDEIEPYGRYKAKIGLGVIERLKDRPDGKLVCVTGMTPTKAGEGKTTTLVGLTQGLGHIGKRPGRLPARAVARPRVRHQGRRRRRRHDPGRADGGPQPPLHRRHPRDRRGQQPARRDARRVDPARQPAQDRRAARRLAPRAGHERPRAAQHRRRDRRPRQRLPARVGLRHHRRLGGDGDPRRLARPAGPARAARRGSPSRSRSTAASRSRPRTSARPARWPCCSRTRSSRT